MEEKNNAIGKLNKSNDPHLSAIRYRHARQKGFVGKLLTY
jgi:hypothetical protein